MAHIQTSLLCNISSLIFRANGTLSTGQHPHCGESACKFATNSGVGKLCDALTRLQGQGITQRELLIEYWTYWKSDVLCSLKTTTKTKQNTLTGFVHVISLQISTDLLE